jgi:hypothetical protein
MAWTNISNANLDVGAPIRSVDILALRDNITAQANGDSGAPKQQTAGIADGAITGAKLSGAQSGSAPVYGARAWVNFNGTGTIAINASANVSSITDNGTGHYRVNFSVAMPDANYSISVSCGYSGGTGSDVPVIGKRRDAALTTTNATIQSVEGSFTAFDVNPVLFVAHR